MHTLSRSLDSSFQHWAHLHHESLSEQLGQCGSPPHTDAPHTDAGAGQAGGSPPRTDVGAGQAGGSPAFDALVAGASRDIINIIIVNIHVEHNYGALLY